MNLTLQEIKEICAKRLEEINREPSLPALAKEGAGMAIRLLLFDIEQSLKGR